MRSYPNSPSGNPTEPLTKASPNYRYSIVFVLRAHSPIPVNTDNLTSSITGEFRKPRRETTAGDLFRDIHKAHFNINTGLQERNEQREKLAREKQEGVLENQKEK